MISRRVLLGALALAGCKDNGDTRPSPVPYNGVLPMSADAWNILYSPGMPPHPYSYDVGWAFDFPQDTNGVDYVTHTMLGSITARSATCMFRVEGTGQLKATEGDAPARVRLFFSRRGDNLSGQGPYEFFRWWSINFVDLVPGSYALSAPLQPEEWYSVLGRRGNDPAAITGFAGAAADISSVGMTFGGMFAGHGVTAVGSVKFICTGYSLE